MPTKHPNPHRTRPHPRIDEHDPAYDPSNPNDPNHPMHAHQEPEGLTKLEVAMTVIYAVALFVLFMDIFVWRP